MWNLLNSWLHVGTKPRDKRMSLPYPSDQGKGIQEQTLQHIPGLAELWDEDYEACSRRAESTIWKQPRQFSISIGAKLQITTVWRLPKIALKKGEVFILFFSLKHRVNTKYFKHLPWLHVTFDYDLIKIKLYLLVRRCKLWLFKLSNLFQQFPWKERGRHLFTKIAMLWNTFYQADVTLLIACKILVRSTEWSPMQIQ